MPSVLFGRIADLVSVPQVMARCGWPASFGGSLSRRGRCPLCLSGGRDDRCFWARPKRWHCYHCNRGGDVLDLWGALRGLDVYHAAFDLCRTFGVKVPTKARARRRAATYVEQEEAR
jgi:hypothetical protein